MNAAKPSARGPLETRASYLTDYRFELRVRERGEVISIGDGIAWISGLPSAAIDQLLALDDGSMALVFHLRQKSLGAILLDEAAGISAGSPVRPASQTLEIPVGDALLGRVVDPLGRPLDGGETPRCDAQRALDIASPPIIARDFVHEPLYTGNKICDAFLPIGRGQRQLLVGDQGLGKTSLAVDVVVNQRSGDVPCVYVLIGQKRSDVVNVIETLRSTGALAHTCVVVAEATAPPGLQYLAPFAGCAIAEYWMVRGRHSLAVFDDLTRHAQAYRALSLLLRRSPGREAYPGDIFFLHSRLLERATCLLPDLGGGSLTALPIIETEEGEIASYIPTNLISITDGQTYFDAALFAAGNVPAIDIKKSVSRIGGKAQDALVRAESGRMHLEYLQFLELERFTRFGTRLDAKTDAAIRRGRVLREIFKQERLSPVTPQFELAWLIAYNDGLFDDIAPPAVAARLRSLQQHSDDLRLSAEHDRALWSSAVREWWKAVS